jgi:hypothetical protein
VIHHTVLYTGRHFTTNTYTGRPASHHRVLALVHLDVSEFDAAKQAKCRSGTPAKRVGPVEVTASRQARGNRVLCAAQCHRPRLVDKKIKCDRNLPICSSCAVSNRQCMRYGMRLSWPQQTDRARAKLGLQTRSSFAPCNIRPNWFLNVTMGDVSLLESRIHGKNDPRREKRKMTKHQQENSPPYSLCANHGPRPTISLELGTIKRPRK